MILIKKIESFKVDLKLFEVLISNTFRLFINKKADQKITSIDSKKQDMFSMITTVFNMEGRYGDLFDTISNAIDSYGKEGFSDYGMSSVEAGIFVASFFGLDIGGGMKPLRKYVLDKMKNLNKDEREKKWTNARKAVFESRYKDYPDKDGVWLIFEKHKFKLKLF